MLSRQDPLLGFLCSTLSPWLYAESWLPVSFFLCIIHKLNLIIYTNGKNCSICRAQCHLRFEASSWVLELVSEDKGAVVQEMRVLAGVVKTLT